MNTRRMTAIFLVGAIAAAAGAASALTPSKYRKVTKKGDREIGNCIFSDKPLLKGKEDEYLVKDTLTCGQFEQITMRCYFPKALGEFKPDLVTWFAKFSMSEGWLSRDWKMDEDSLTWDQGRVEFFGKSGDFNWMFQTPLQPSDKCDYAKQQKLKEFTLKGLVKVFKKVGADFKTEWDRYKNAYITKEIPKYDPGTTIAEGELTVLVP